MKQLQSYIWLTASSYMGKYLCISSYIRKPFLIYDFATAPLWISLYMRKILLSFLSVHSYYTTMTILVNELHFVNPERAKLKNHCNSRPFFPDDCAVPSLAALGLSEGIRLLTPPLQPPPPPIILCGLLSYLSYTPPLPYKLKKL